MNEDFEELNENEREQFKRLARQKTPPNFLEEKVVERLRESNLLGSRQRRNGWNFLKPVAVFAGLLLIFVFGAASGIFWFSTTSPLSTAEPDSPQFILLLRSPERAEEISSDELTKRVKEYGVWAKEKQENGFLLKGEKLKDEIRIIAETKNGLKISEDNLNQANKAVEGYFVIQAGNYQQAQAVAQSCPHLKYGGSIEVREIERF